ncbi:MAG TPA: RNA polymerase sigma factor [Terriglobales bacterium]|nr:RNA polymerase sigma factor [Terriglobales bacterium]
MATHQAAITALNAARAGDDAAFGLLLEPLLEPAHRLACGLLHDRQAAEDAVQEAALKAWRKLAQLREGSEMRPWFLAIVANECRATRRSRWWSVIRNVEREPASELRDEAIAAGVELRRALLAMDPDKRLVLVLHWYLDLPVQEVAAVTGLSLRGAETRLLRATRELRKRMEASRGRQ